MHSRFSIILFPSHEKGWSFIDGTVDLPGSPHGLSFHMTGPIIPPEQTSPETKPLPERLRDESSIKSVFRSLFLANSGAPGTLDIDKLFYWPDATLTRRAFLMFPHGSDSLELDLLTLYLQASGVKVYNSLTRGAWKYWRDRFAGSGGGGGAIIVGLSINFVFLILTCTSSTTASRIMGRSLASLSLLTTNLLSGQSITALRRLQSSPTVRLYLLPMTWS